MPLCGVRRVPATPAAEKRVYMHGKPPSSPCPIKLMKACSCKSHTAPRTPHPYKVSYDAFEQLAHPLYGRIMLEFRPADCSSGALLPSYTPGYISRTDIYGQDGTQPGWNWFPYSDSYSEYAAPGAAHCTVITHQSNPQPPALLLT